MSARSRPERALIDAADDDRRAQRDAQRRANVDSARRAEMGSPSMRGALPTVESLVSNSLASAMLAASFSCYGIRIERPRPRKLFILCAPLYESAHERSSVVLAVIGASRSLLVRAVCAPIAGRSDPRSCSRNDRRAVRAAASDASPAAMQRRRSASWSSWSSLRRQGGQDCRRSARHRIEGDRIVSVGPAAGVRRFGEQRIDLSGSTVLPGLIDEHTHLTGNPS